jgi:hypothetical protein
MYSIARRNIGVRPQCCAGPGRSVSPPARSGDRRAGPRLVRGSPATRGGRRPPTRRAAGRHRGIGRGACAAGCTLRIPQRSSALRSETTQVAGRSRRAAELDRRGAWPGPRRARRRRRLRGAGRTSGREGPRASRTMMRRRSHGGRRSRDTAATSPTTSAEPPRRRRGGGRDPPETSLRSIRRRARTRGSSTCACGGYDRAQPVRPVSASRAAASRARGHRPRTWPHTSRGRSG